MHSHLLMYPKYPTHLTASNRGFHMWWTEFLMWSFFTIISIIYNYYLFQIAIKLPNFQNMYGMMDNQYNTPNHHKHKKAPMYTHS